MIMSNKSTKTFRMPANRTNSSIRVGTLVLLMSASIAIAQTSTSQPNQSFAGKKPVATAKKPVPNSSSKLPSVKPVEERNVLAHESFLASDALNGRGSATRDEWIAAVYIGSQLRQFGIEPAGDKDESGKTGYVQVVPLTVQKFTASPVLNAGSFSFTHGKDLAVLRAGSAN